MLTKCITLIMTIFLLWGCDKSEIKGVIQDPFGNPLIDVQVSIVNSELKTKTGKNGQYAIPYITGTFKIKYVKSGYTTQITDFTIQEKTSYPAQPIVLYPIPKEPGLYYLHDNNLVKLSPTKIISQETKLKTTNLFGKEKRGFYPAEILNPVVVEGKVQFIDMHPEELVPMRLNEKGDFLQLTTEGLSLKLDVVYDGSISEEKNEVGEEKLCVRTLDLKQGAYAWVEFGLNIFGHFLPKHKGVCFPFVVRTKDHSQSRGTEPSLKYAKATADYFFPTRPGSEFYYAITDTRNEPIQKETLQATLLPATIINNIKMIPVKKKLIRVSNTGENIKDEIGYYYINSHGLFYYGNKNDRAPNIVALNENLLKNPVEKGSSWKGETKIYDYYSIIESIDEEIAVPAGNFVCIRIKSFINRKDGKGRAEFLKWKTRDVGDVKIKTKYYLGNSTFERISQLTSYKLN